MSANLVETNLDTVMLLCQSARNVTVLRALPLSDWLRVLQVSASSGPGTEEAQLKRAVRIENRVAQKAVISPTSLLRGKLTGNAGAMAAWVAQLAAEWSDSGNLFNPVDMGGLGMTQSRFRISVGT